jgi:hypothetical protein
MIGLKSVARVSAVVVPFVIVGTISPRAEQHGRGIPPESAAPWEHMRVIGERLGVPRTLTFGAPPSHSVAIGDFDGDGDADIAVGATDAREVSILLGDASAPFASIVVAARSDWPIVDAEADVDGIAYRTQSGALFSTTTVWYRASNAGEHTKSMNGALAVVADFDGDGTADVAAAPAGATALASGDFDGDGVTDLVAADGRSASVIVLFGDGHGRFTRRRVIDVGIAAAPHGLAVSDIDRDGIADLVVLGDEGALSILLGDGSGGLLPYARATVDTRLRSDSRDAVAGGSEPDEYHGIVSLSLNPASIAGGSGATSTGSITLDAPAPAGGVVVTLTSSNLELAVSAPSITVPAGASTATFTIGTNKNYRRYSGLAFNVTISAAHGATTRSATLSLTAQPRPGTLSSFDAHNEGSMCFGIGVRQTPSGITLELGSAGNLFNCVPPPNPVGQDGTCTFSQECSLGCEFRPVTNGFKFKDVCATTGPFPVAVNPKLLVGGNPSLATLRLNAAAPVNSSGTLSSATVLANTIPNIPTPIPAGATTANADVLTARVTSPQFAPIDGSYSTPRADGSRGGRGGLTWLALVTGTPSPFGLTLFDFDPPTLTSVVGGGSVLATTRMNQVAPAPAIATATMTVSSSNPAVASASQPNVTFTEGSSNAGFFIETHPVSADTTVTISAALGAITLTRQLTVRATPSASSVTSFFLDPFEVTGGNASIGTVVLNGMAPSGGAVVTLVSSNSTVASMPASVTVPAGSDRVSFSVQTSAVATSTTVTLNANFGGWAATSLIVSPASAPVTLTSLTLNPTSVAGGSTSTGTVSLSAAAPAGGTVVTLSSNIAAASVPASVAVPAGATSATFTIGTTAVSASTTATITGTLNGTSQSASLTINSTAPPPPPPGNATLTVTATGRSGERVTSTPAGINVAVGSTGSASFATGTSITLSVSNGRDAIWSGACSSGGNKTKTCTFTLNAAASVTANVQ